MELEELGNRVDYIENRMGDYAWAHNELVDAHNDVTEEIFYTKSKMADLEDGSHWNNVKFRGIAESVHFAELLSFLQHMIAELLLQ